MKRKAKAPLCDISHISIASREERSHFLTLLFVSIIPYAQYDEIWFLNIMDLAALRGLGYNFFITLPTTFVIHLRLSPLTSPYSIPFIYRSIVDILTLPIYTKVLPRILARTPLLTNGQPGKKLEEVLRTFGRRVKVSELGLRKGIDGLSAGAAEARQNDSRIEESMGAQDLINVEGLSFWDGLRAMHAVGKEKGLVWTTTRW